MYKLLTSNRGTDDISIGFHRYRGRTQQELTNNKNITSKYHVRNMLKDIFNFAEHQENAFYGLGLKLRITRNKSEIVLNKAEAIADAGVKNDHIHWYVPYYTPSIPQQGILSK